MRRTLYSLTQRQARWLTAARDTEGGAYVGISAGTEPHELVDAGVANFREVHQVGGTRSALDARPCEWTDYYLVHTDREIELLISNKSG